MWCVCVCVCVCVRVCNRYDVLHLANAKANKFSIQWCGFGSTSKPGMWEGSEGREGREGRDEGEGREGGREGREGRAEVTHTHTHV